MWSLNRPSTPRRAWLSTPLAALWLLLSPSTSSAQHSSTGPEGLPAAAESPGSEGAQVVPEHRVPLRREGAVLPLVVLASALLLALSLAPVAVSARERFQRTGPRVPPGPAGPPADDGESAATAVRARDLSEARARAESLRCRCGGPWTFPAALRPEDVVLLAGERVLVAVLQCHACGGQKRLFVRLEEPGHG